MDRVDMVSPRAYWTCPLNFLENQMIAIIQ
jgi:hypothetical protein